MPLQYISDYAAVLVATVAGLAAVALLLLLSRVLAPRRYTPQKGTAYECGMLPIGQHWSQMHIRYYLFAIFFVIFDIEVVFLFPWAVVFAQIGPFAFWEMVLFIGMLLFGLIYAWRKGVLRWE